MIPISQDLDEFVEATMKRARALWAGVQLYRMDTLDMMSWKCPGVDGFTAAAAIQAKNPALNRFDVVKGDADQFVYWGNEPARVELSIRSTRQSVSSAMTAAHELGHAYQYIRSGGFVMQRLKTSKERHLALEADAWLIAFELAEGAGLIQSDYDRVYALEWSYACWSSYEKAQYVKA